MGKTAIIGGGIAGLTAAFALRKEGADCVVFEASNRPGGAIRTERAEGFAFESGPNTLLALHPELDDLFAALDLTRDVRAADPAAKRRYVVRDGRMLPLPASPGAFFATPLFSGRAKFRLFAEPFVRGAQKGREESVAEFVERRLGREFLDYAIEPFVGGVYAGDPARLSVQYAFPKLYALEKRYGSMLKGALLGRRERRKRAETSAKDAAMRSFSAGMEVLPRRLAERLGDVLRLETPVSSLRRDGTEWIVADERFSDVVLALPAHVLPRLRAPFDLSLFGRVVYPPVASVSLGFASERIARPLDGFGVLIPGIEKRFALGALFLSTLFPGRAPEGCALLTAFVGGAKAPERARLPEGELVERTVESLRDLLGLSGAPLFSRVVRHERAIAQYDLGYGRFLERMNSIEREFSGIRFAGHARDGISVANAIRSGLRVAREILGTA